MMIAYETTPTALGPQRGSLLTTGSFLCVGVCVMLSHLTATIEILKLKNGAIIIEFDCKTNKLKRCLSQSEAVRKNMAARLRRKPFLSSPVFTSQCC